MEREAKQKPSLKRSHLLQMALFVAAVGVIAILSGRIFFRVDLTSEKRYSLASSSRELLGGLEEVVFVRIYLDGDLPPEFVHFRRSIRELLDEFRAYAGERLQYEFINLYEEPDEAIRNRMIGELYDNGLRVTSIQLKDEQGGTSSRIIFPGAMIAFRGVQMPVNLLKNNPSLSHQVNLNNSIQTLEYEFISAIHSLTMEQVPRIAFTEGHGELDSLQTHSLMDELRNFFQVDRGFINGNVEALLPYEAVVIARPERPFSEADKFAIDQYIMSGGRVLFLLDPVYSYADSLTGGTTVALANPVGLEDILFQYGIRINYNLVADMQCNLVPVNTAPAGENARFTMMPWVYHPLFTGLTGHPVTRGLNYIKGEFASSLDTLEGTAEGVEKSVLLSTSASSRQREVPLYISMEEVTRQPDPALFNQSRLPVGVLLEGRFTSFFRNYPVPKGVCPPDWEVRKEGEPASVFVLADGDMAANEVRYEQGEFRAQPLGYDRYTRQTFGNREFFLNLINYMTDEAGIMELRSREFKLRLLNREVINDRGRAWKWKVFNMLVPLILVVLSGILIQLIRKRRYGN